MKRSIATCVMVAACSACFGLIDETDEAATGGRRPALTPVASAPSPVLPGYPLYPTALGSKLVNYVAVGDSITQGFATPDYWDAFPVVVSTILGTGFVLDNEGIAGKTAADADANWSALYAAHVTASPPTTVTILFGTNDLANDAATPAETWTHVASIASQFRDAGATRIVLLGILPSIEITSSTRDTFLALMRANWATVADAYVDPPAQIVAAPNSSATQWFEDGIHPTPNGHIALAFALLPAIVP